MKSQIKQNHLNRIIRCTRYAFMPNRLNFREPKNQDDVLELYTNANKKLIRNSTKPLLMDFESTTLVHGFEKSDIISVH